MLCLECSEFLSNINQKIGRSFQNVWPSFVWNILMDRDMVTVHGNLFPQNGGTGGLSL